MTRRVNDRPVSDLVDEIFAAPKYLEGQGFWKPGTSENTERLVYPVLLEDGSQSCEVSATVKLWSEIPWFSISLLYGARAVYRLDHDPPHSVHLNPFEKGNPLSGLTIEGPHCHTWLDNRRCATRTQLPKELPWRRSFGVQTWDVAFRWFLGEVGIDQPPNHMIPAYPERLRLL